ncbi:MAG: proteasome assembly chaperone family protein [Candidatus Thermoplasmatota archaeon]|nr:proteasome assembly chaperone family protein [Candidatus Thermoplasmatota archaeon]
MVIQLDDVQIVDFEEMNLANGSVIAGFPSIGLVSTIVANYLIDALGLKQIGAIDSPHFPTLSVVHTGEPLAPVRIYGGTLANGQKLAVFVSEFKPKPNLINSLSDAIMSWSKKKGCRLLISPEGMVVEGKSAEEEMIVDAYAIGSTENARAVLQAKNIPQFKNGIIAGVSGVLLNKGKQEKFDVISILAEAHPNYPDARAAASAINVIATVIGVEINVGPLYDEAERIEKQLQRFHKQAKPIVSGAAQIPQPSMYG